MIEIIAFVGKAQAGKSTAAKHLVENYGFVRLRFADTLKSMLYAMGLSYEEIDGYKKISECELLGGNTPRYTMQTLGTEWGRKLISEDLWINCLDRNMRSFIRAGAKKFVIDDVRFLNEARYIARVSEEENFKVCLVRIHREYVKQKDIHQSETEMDLIDTHYSIGNFGTIEEFRMNVFNVLKLWEGK